MTMEEHGLQLPPDSEPIEYNRTVLEHAFRPRNFGKIARPDGFGVSSRHCGDAVQMYLRVEGDRIADVKFESAGCVATVASASALTELVHGKGLLEALDIDPEHVIEALQGLPEQELHSVELAASAFRAAVHDCLKMRREPWKKAYRQTGPY